MAETCFSFDRRVRMAAALTWIVAASTVAGPTELRAQEDEPPSEEPAIADSVAADTLISPVEARVAPSTDTVETRSGPSPMSAFLRSVVIPGWGQLAADKPVRGAFYFAMQTATVYMVFRTQSRIDDAESEELKEARRDQREDWLVLAGFWALASGVDAWVSAQMWGFEGEVVPPPDGSAGVAVRVQVPMRLF